MLSTAALRQQLLILLAADTTTLAPAADNLKMALIKNAVVPSEAIVFADLQLADFDGSTPLDIGLNTQPTGLDPFNNDIILDFKPPTTGFRWETTGLTNLPQTIYGYAVLTNALDDVYCVALFDTPIVLTAINQRVDDLVATLRVAPNTLN